jgi:hypothetical protein
MALIFFQHFKWKSERDWSACCASVRGQRLRWIG